MFVNEFIIKNGNNRVVKYKNKLYGFNTNKITISKKQVFNIGAFFNKKILVDLKKLKSLLGNHKIIEVISKKTENIKTDLYNIKIIALLKVSKKPLEVPNEKQRGGKIKGVNGVFTYNLWTLDITGTALKNIMFIGERHGNQDHCEQNYVDMYKTLISNMKTNITQASIDIFYEQDPDIICDKTTNCDKSWLNKLRKILDPYAHFHYKKKSLLRVHWTDPVNNYDVSSIYPKIPEYPDTSENKEMFNKVFMQDLRKFVLDVSNYTDVPPFETLSSDYKFLFYIIKSKDDLNKLIFFNKKIIAQADKSILSKSEYVNFINHIICIVLGLFEIDDKEWYYGGIFYIQRLSMDFYVFFRMLRKISPNELNVKNAIFHAGQNHTRNLRIIFNEFNKNYMLLYPNKKKTIEHKFISPTSDNECLDFTFNTFIKKANEEREEREEREGREGREGREEREGQVSSKSGRKKTSAVKAS
jgi:hypothetical protein